MFELTWKSIEAIGDFIIDRKPPSEVAINLIADTIHVLRRRVGSDGGADGALQAATVFYHTVASQDASCRYVYGSDGMFASDRLYALAVDIADELERVGKSGKWVCTTNKNDGGAMAIRMTKIASQLWGHLKAWALAVDNLRSKGRDYPREI